MTNKFDNVHQCLDALRRGEMIIVMDSSDRENEGDLLIPAECITPEKINFMSKYGRGLICLTLTEERSKELGIKSVEKVGIMPERTNFLNSIDAMCGVTTGISAADRSHTIKVALAKESTPADLVQPGHVFPLQAVEGGVLVRAGHTEAGCDLARMVGYQPAAVIVEILNDDGTMARYDDLKVFAEQHELQILMIDELIRYRMSSEQVVQRLTYRKVRTRHGDMGLHLYKDKIHNRHHLAIVIGDIATEDSVLVRVHRSKYLFDLLHLDNRGQLSSWSFHNSLDYIFQNKPGVMLLLSDSNQNLDLDSLLFEQVTQFGDNLTGKAAGENVPAPTPVAWSERETGVGSQILRDLNLKNIAVLGRSQNTQYHGLSAYGLNIKRIIEYGAK